MGFQTDPLDGCAAVQQIKTGKWKGEHMTVGCVESELAAIIVACPDGGRMVLACFHKKARSGWVTVARGQGASLQDCRRWLAESYNAMVYGLAENTFVQATVQTEAERKAELRKEAKLALLEERLAEINALMEGFAREAKN